MSKRAWGKDASPAVKKILRAVARLKTAREVGTVKWYANDRLEAVQKAEHKAKIARAVAEAAEWPVGTVIYCNATAMFLDGVVHRGTKATITRPFDRRWGRMHVEVEGRGRWWFAGREIERYEWKTTAPDNPASAEEIARAKGLGRMMTQVLAGRA